MFHVKQKNTCHSEEALADEESPAVSCMALGALRLKLTLGAVIIPPEILRFALSRPQAGIRSATAACGGS